MIEKMGGDFLQWLRGFHFVVTYGSTAAAASAMGLRQPTVSHQVQMLEAELGVQLFRRTLRKMVPTTEGLALYERATMLFEDIREMKSVIGRKREESVKGEISLVTTHSVAENYLPEIIRSFSDRHPETFFTITGVTEAAVIVDKVQSAAMELGIVHGQHYPKTLEIRPLFIAPLALIVSKKMAAERNICFTRAADGSLADMRELSDMPFIAFSPNTILTHYLDEIQARHGMKVRITARVNTSMLLARYVELGFGVSILDVFTAAAHPDIFDIYPIPTVAAPRTYNLIYRKKSYMSPQTLAFIAHLQDDESTVSGIMICKTENREKLTSPVSGGGS